MDVLFSLSVPDRITGRKSCSVACVGSLCVCSWMKLSSFLKGDKNVFLKKVLVLFSSLLCCLWEDSDGTVVVVEVTAVVIVDVVVVVTGSAVVNARGRSKGSPAIEIESDLKQNQNQAKQ